MVLRGYLCIFRIKYICETPFSVSSLNHYLLNFGIFSPLADPSTVGVEMIWSFKGFPVQSSDLDRIYTIHLWLWLQATNITTWLSVQPSIIITCLVVYRKNTEFIDLFTLALGDYLNIFLFTQNYDSSCYSLIYPLAHYKILIRGKESLITVTCLHFNLLL